MQARAFRLKTAFRYDWRAALLLFGLALLVIAIIMAADIRQVLSIWVDNEAYRHCVLVLLISLYWIWQMRGRLGQVCPIIWLHALTFVCAAGMLWLLGAAAEVSLLRHIGLMAMIQSCAAVLFGKQAMRLLAFPLLYAFLAVPFGEEVVPFLQMHTAQIAIALLHLFAVPAFLNGTQIATPNGLYLVAEACAGVNFLLAMLAYGVLLSQIFFKHWSRRAMYIALCALVPVFGNALRVFATIYLGYRTSPAIAGGVDHIVFGWVFFAILMGAMTALAWPFADRSGGNRQHPMGAKTQSKAPSAIRSVFAAIVGILGVLMMCSALARQMQGRHEAWLRAGAILPNVSGWSRLSTSASPDWTPVYNGADQLACAEYVNSRGQAVDMALALFADQRDGKELIGHGQGASWGGDQNWIWAGNSPASSARALRNSARSEIIISATGGRRQVVTYYLVGGELAKTPGEAKWLLIKSRLLRRTPIAAALILSTRIMAGQDGTPLIAAFQTSLGAPEDVINQAVAQAQVRG